MALRRSCYRALGNINDNSIRKFFNGRDQDQRANVTYRAGYAFLKKLRLLKGRPKSEARLENEAENPQGVSDHSRAINAIRRHFFLHCYISYDPMMMINASSLLP